MPVSTPHERTAPQAREIVAWAAEQDRAQGAGITIGAVNSQRDGPYLLDMTANAIGFLDAVGADQTNSTPPD
jgi:hypothetical protein